MPPGGTQLAHDPDRSKTTVPSVSMLRRVEMHAILGGFSTEIFEKFSRSQNLAFDIIDVHNVVGVATALALQRPTPTFFGVAANEMFLGTGLNHGPS